MTIKDIVKKWFSHLHSKNLSSENVELFKKDVYSHCRPEFECVACSANDFESDYSNFLINRNLKTLTKLTETSDEAFEDRLREELEELEAEVIDMHESKQDEADAINREGDRI